MSGNCGELEARIKSLEDALSQTNKRQLAIKNLLDTIVSATKVDPDVIEKGPLPAGPGVNVRFMDAIDRIDTGLNAMAEGVRSTAELVSKNSQKTAEIDVRLFEIESELKEISERS